MTENAETVNGSNIPGYKTEESVISESAMGLPMVDISVEDMKGLTPVESAILYMDKELQTGLRLVKDVKNHICMLESVFKLMSYELSIISKNLKSKE